MPKKQEPTNSYPHLHEPHGLEHGLISSSSFWILPLLYSMMRSKARTLALFVSFQLGTEADRRKDWKQRERSLKIFFNVYLFLTERERQRDRVWVGRGRERGGHRIWSSSRLWAVSTETDTGLKLTDCEIMTWAEVGRSTDWATQAPHIQNFLSSKSTTQIQQKALLRLYLLWY